MIIMKNNSTIISENNISFITGKDKAPEEMIQFLNEGAMFRSFTSLLTGLYEKGDLEVALTEGLAELNHENRESTARKVKNWLSERSLPKNRETLFQICFILQLNECESCKVLGSVSDTGIHYRNPEELAYAYALRTWKSYRKAVELKHRAVSIYVSEKDKCMEETSVIYTRQIRNAFVHVSEDQEFYDFIREYSAELGKLHETAYRKFIELLECLQNPEGAGGEIAGEKEYTLEKIMDTYIQMKVPVEERSRRGDHKKQRKVKNMTGLQKLVRRYWPNESTLVKMRTRKEDVNRKTLLLLYLVTEAFDADPGDKKEVCYYEDLEEDADTLLEIRLEKMNLFLEEYGMNRLDPGNVFDFLILYAMRAEEDEDARTRMENVLKALFEDRNTI